MSTFTLYRREFGSFYHGRVMMDEVGVLLDIDEKRRTAVLLKHGNADDVEAYYTKARAMEIASPELFNLVLLRSRHWPTALLNRFIEYSGGAERWWFEGEPSIEIDAPLRETFERIWRLPNGTLRVRNVASGEVIDLSPDDNSSLAEQLRMALLPHPKPATLEEQGRSGEALDALADGLDMLVDMLVMQTVVKRLAP